MMQKKEIRIFFTAMMFADQVAEKAVRLPTSSQEHLEKSACYFP